MTPPMSVAISARVEPAPYAIRPAPATMPSRLTPMFDHRMPTSKPVRWRWSTGIGSVIGRSGGAGMGRGLRQQ
jgi:hypothetical protein